MCVELFYLKLTDSCVQERLRDAWWIIFLFAFEDRTGDNFHLKLKKQNYKLLKQTNKTKKRALFCLVCYNQCFLLGLFSVVGFLVHISAPSDGSEASAESLMPLMKQ